MNIPGKPFYAGGMSWNITSHGPLARTVLAGATVALVGVALAGCSSSANSVSPTISATAPPSSSTSAPSAIASAKGSDGSSTSVPIPSGTATSKAEFTCSGLTSELSLPGYSLDASYAPTPDSPEGSSIARGGLSCRWQVRSTAQSVTVSLDNVSPQDYRDIATNLSATMILSNFGSSNDSQEFFSSDGSLAVAIVINTTYKITVRSDGPNTAAALGPIAHGAEQVLLG
jgi:hypothetical protein